MRKRGSLGYIYVDHINEKLLRHVSLSTLCIDRYEYGTSKRMYRRRHPCF